MPFPFLYLALSLVFGIWFANVAALPQAPSAWAMAVALLLAWAFFGLKKNALCFFCLLFSTTLLGASLSSHFEARYKENRLHGLGQGSYMDFYGRLYRSPSPGLDRDFLYLRVERVFAQNREEAITGNLRISVPHSADFPLRPDLAVGDHLKVSAQIVPAREYRNFKEPFSRMYLKTQLLHALATMKSPLLVEKTENGRPSPVRFMSLLRTKFERKLEANFSAPQGRAKAALTPEGSVLEALVLGERGRLPQATARALQASGLFHLIAISGAHIGIISFMIFGFLRFLRVPSRAAYVFLILFLILYSFLVEGRASVFRAAIMSIAFLVGKLFWKDVHLVNTISLSAFAILLFNPFQLFEAGFQLTFAATLSIILFFPKIMAVLPRLPLRISEMFAMSVAAQAGVLPFIALTFNRVTFSALLLNLVGIPLVGLIMATGYIFLPVSLLSAVLARWLTAGLTFLIKVFLASTHLLEGVAILSYRIPTPRTWVVAGYFLFLGLLVVPPRFNKFRIGALAAFSLFFFLIIVYPFPSVSRNLVVTFIDVGQGDSILVEFPGRTKMLVDGGGLPVGTFDIGESVVAPFLWNKGIKRIDDLVLTHAHPDHLNGLVAVARDFRVGEFWETFSPPDDPKYGELKGALGAANQRRVFRGFSHREGKVAIEVLSPREGQSLVLPVENELSLVMKITYSAQTFLLTADAGVETEKELLSTGQELKSTVLKSGHHGSNTASSEAFIRAVAPDVVVISVGKGNIYGLPHQEILDRYKTAGAEVFRTDLDGAVEISTDGKKITTRTNRDL